MFEEASLHESDPCNWRLTKKGLRLIDYAADPLRTSWAMFILTRKDKPPSKPLALSSVSYTHLRAHETKANLVCRLLLEKKKKKKK